MTGVAATASTIGMIFECGPQGADKQVCEHLAKHIRPEIEIKSRTLDSKVNLLRDAGKTAALLLKDGCAYVMVVWDPRPAWPDKKNRPCRHAERKTVLMRLAEAGVSPHAPVYLVCIEQELECWLLANDRAISALLSTPAHPYSGSKVQVPDSVVQPKSEMLKHFKKARGWRCISPRMRAHKEKACNTSALHCNTLSDRSPSCPPH